MNRLQGYLSTKQLGFFITDFLVNYFYIKRYRNRLFEKGEKMTKAVIFLKLSKLFICLVVISFFTELIVPPANAAKKITSWTMFMVPILSSKTQSKGGLTLRLINNTMPHFNESATSDCNLENRDGKNLLICTSACRSS